MKLNRAFVVMATIPVFCSLHSIKAMEEENLENQLFTAIEKTPTEGVDLEEIKRLLAAGASVNAKNEYGSTPLSQAAGQLIYGYDPTELVQILIDAGANVNAQDKNGQTVLHFAAQLRNEDLVLQLLKVGADPTLKITQGRNKGKTPYEITRDDTIKKLLLLYPTPQEIESIITALAVFTRKGQYHLPKDLRKNIMKNLLIQNLINEKLEKAQKELPEYDKRELREIIETGVIKALKP